MGQIGAPNILRIWAATRGRPYSAICSRRVALLGGQANFGSLGGVLEWERLTGEMGTTGLEHESKEK